MRKLGSLLLAAALAAAVVLGASSFAAAEKPVTVVAGQIHAEFNGGFSPRVLSKTKPTPVSFNISGKLKSLDPAEAHVPALKEFLLEGDRHASISVKGIPVCKNGTIQSTTTAGSRKACGAALIGTGKPKSGSNSPNSPTKSSPEANCWSSTAVSRVA